DIPRPMDLGIEGRTALVTGARRGLGLGIAQVFGREGARVALTSRSQENLEAAAGQVDGETAIIVADSGDLERMSALPGEVEDALGPVDILVTNTGGPPAGGGLDHSPEQWQAAYETLVLSPRALIEAVLPGMRERGWGRIVNTASIGIREPIGGLALSNAHRAATMGLFKTLAAEVAADGVTLNTVATGRIATERIAELWGSMENAEAGAQREVPVGRLGTIEEYGDFVAFLCSDRAAYLTGATIQFDGGLSRSH
ncbi:MAG: SDR family oxidoreductase, partial [Solirubrobacterales bacterium]